MKTSVLKSVKKDYDIIIVGAGLIGLTTALSCAYNDVTVALVDITHPHDARADGRASAIAASCYGMLETLGVTQSIAHNVRPIKDMLISDGKAGLISPLNLHLDSRHLDGPTAHMIENDILRRSLLEQVERHDRIDLIAPVELLDVNRSSANVDVHLSNNMHLAASLLVAADGRHSSLRKLAGIGVSKLNYNQKALVTTITHERPHDDVAHQVFYSGGPLALLPLTQNRISIVWSDRARAIDALVQLPEHDFLSEFRRRSGDFLGDMFVSAERQVFPLSLQISETYTSTRLALVGDAAHAIHPLAGQGLNMGLRDAAALADVIGRARALGLDIGGATLDDYAAWRNFDNESLAMVTDVLNKLFSNNNLPIRHLRRLGLFTVNNTSMIKTFLMKEASGYNGNIPSLLRA